MIQVKIDLLKDRGVLAPITFSASLKVEKELSEDELIAETLRRRHMVPKSEKDTETAQISQETAHAKKEKSTSSIGWLVFLLIIVLAGSAYYLNQNDLLKPAVDIVKYYWMDTLGIERAVEIDTTIDENDFNFAEEPILSEEQFNQLMPVTDDIAALADSIAAVPVDSLIVRPVEMEQVDDTSTDYIPVSETPVYLSDDDILIINNRSLLLMVSEILDNIPDNSMTAHLFLKRDALRMTAPTGGEWVDQVRKTMDRFVLGSFNSTEKEGKVHISSKFEIIMNAEQEFQAQVLDGLRLLDVLANPFSDYLVEIVIDLTRGVDDNPATFTFVGSKQEIQYIISSWAETRSNFLLRSVDLKFQVDKILLSFDVLFFNYTP